MFNSELSIAISVAWLETGKWNEERFDLALDSTLAFDALMSMPIVEAEKRYGVTFRRALAEGE